MSTPQTFGRWTVIGDPRPHSRNAHRSVRCMCSCGHEASVYLTHLRSGRSTSCRSCARNPEISPVSKALNISLPETRRLYGLYRRSPLGEWSFEDFAAVIRNLPNYRKPGYVLAYPGGAPTWMQRCAVPRTPVVLTHRGRALSLAEFARQVTPAWARSTVYKMSQTMTGDEIAAAYQKPAVRSAT